MKTNNLKIGIRNIVYNDLGLISDYWSNGLPEHLNKRLIARQSKKELEEKFREILNDESKKQAILIITLNEKTIGYHAVTDIITNESAIMHAHIFLSCNRNQGFGRISYVLAAREFIKRFNLEKIIFKTSNSSSQAIRIKEILGLEAIEEITFHGKNFSPTKGKLFIWEKNKIFSKYPFLDFDTIEDK